jgi:hypothetical protein
MAPVRWWSAAPIFGWSKAGATTTSRCPWLARIVAGTRGGSTVGVLNRQPTKGSTRSRWMWPRRDR